jgi:hypothetical protein
MNDEQIKDLEEGSCNLFQIIIPGFAWRAIETVSHDKR